MSEHYQMDLIDLPSSQLLLIDSHLAKRMGLPPVNENGESILTKGLLEDWWRFYLRDNGLINKNGTIIVNDFMRNTFSGDMILLRMSRYLIDWYNLLRLLREHVTSIDPQDVDPQFLQYLNDLQMEAMITGIKYM